MANELSGQVAIVTGAGSGFGRSIALAFAAAGAAVTVSSRNRANLDETVAMIERTGGRAFAVEGDTTIKADVLRVRDEAEKRFGPTTTLVVDAGIAWPFGPIWEVSAEDWWMNQTVHTRGTILWFNAIVPGMIERGHGRVVVVSSGGALRVTPYHSGYTVSKAAQIFMTQHLAEEAKEHGIIAIPISPGRATTNLSRETSSSPDAQKWLPDLAQRMASRAQADTDAALERCGEFVTALASGRYDALSGVFIRAEDDIDEVLRQTMAKKAPA